LILTLDNKNAASSLIENNPVAAVSFPLWTKQRILNSTVKLSGSTKTRGTVFTGSGVIVNVDTHSVTILTALHNVMVWGRAGRSLSRLGQLP
jgi:hypothetical protein